MLRQYALLADGGGVYAVAPDLSRFVWGGYYEPRSLIWRSRWVTTDGIVECREALALPADAHTAVLLRRIHVIDVEQRQLRGNLPQAFVHALLFETAHRRAGHGS